MTQEEINKAAQEYKVNEAKIALHLIREPDALEMNMKLFCAEDIEAAFKAGAKWVGEREHRESKQPTIIEAWVCRDRELDKDIFDSDLFLATNKPDRDVKLGYWKNTYHYIPLNPNLFPTVTWEDSEPKKVKITIELEEE